MLFYLTLEGDAGPSYPWERPPSSTSHTHNLFVVFDSHNRSTETAAHPDGLAFVFMKDPEELLEYLVRDLFPLDPNLQQEARRGHNWQTQLLAQCEVQFLMIQDGIGSDAPRNTSRRDYDHESQSALQANVELLVERTKAIQLGHEVTEAQRNNRRLENELSRMRSQLQAQQLRAAATNQEEHRMAALTGTRPPVERWKPTERPSSVAGVDEDGIGFRPVHLDVSRDEPRNRRGSEQFEDIKSSSRTSSHPIGLDKGDQKQGIVNRFFGSVQTLRNSGSSTYSGLSDEPHQRVLANATRLADAQPISPHLRTDEDHTHASRRRQNGPARRRRNVGKGKRKAKEVDTANVTNHSSRAEAEAKDYDLAVALTFSADNIDFGVCPHPDASSSYNNETGTSSRTFDVPVLGSTATNTPRRERPLPVSDVL